MSATTDTPAIAAAAVGETVQQPTTTETPAVEAKVVETPVVDDAGKATDDGKTGEQTTEAAPKPKDGINKRMSELTTEKKVALARAETAEKSATALQDTLKQALETIERLGGQKKVTDTIEAQAAADPRPAKDKFDDPNAYDDALIEWSARQATRVATAELERKAAEKDKADAARTETEKQDAARAAAEDAWNGRVSTFQERREKAIEAIPDYAEVAEADNVSITFPMREAILDADNGPQIAYHLGRNEGAEAARIAKLSPVQQIFEIGKIAAELARPKPNISKAPAPITATGSRQTAAERSREEMGGDEYYAVRNPEIQAARRH